MKNSNNSEIVSKNYKKENNLLTRINLHQKYEQKSMWSHWLFTNYHFFEGCNVLELGCGTGYMWENNMEQLPKHATVTLTDLSQGMVDVVKKKFAHMPNVLTKVMNIEEIDSEDNAYDIIIANSMLYHVPNISKALTQIYRVLKPNGFFYAFTFGENGQQKFFHQKLKEFNHEIDAFGEGSFSFILQNGREILSEKFKNIIRYDFIDSLDVTDASDIVNYILSSNTMSTVEEEKTAGLLEFFEGIKDLNGIIKIPREYCMFVSQK